jgi:hypothetical protein
VLVGLSQQLDFRLDRLTDTVTTGFSKVETLMDNWRKETDKMVGCSLVEAGTNLLRRSPPSSPGNTSVRSNLDKESARRELALQSAPTNSTTQVAIQLSTESETEAAAPEEYPRFRSTTKHRNLQSVWDLWFGVGKFKDVTAALMGVTKDSVELNGGRISSMTPHIRRCPC